MRLAEGSPEDLDATVREAEDLLDDRTEWPRLAVRREALVVAVCRGSSVAIATAGMALTAEGAVGFTAGWAAVAAAWDTSKDLAAASACVFANCMSAVA